MSLNNSGAEVKHTPGPWEANARLSGSENDKGWYLHGGNHSQRRWIADVSPVCEDDGNASEEGRANLALITAAPDLFAPACELLALYDWRPKLAKMEKDPNADPKEVKRLLREYGERKKAGWIALRAAIAKAAGL